MFRSYFKIARRILLRYKFFSTINIIGLAVGLACCTLIGLFIIDEFSYDKQNEDASRIYRIVDDLIHDAGAKDANATTPPAIAVAIENFPEVENTVRLFTIWDHKFYVRNEHKKFMEGN